MTIKQKVIGEKLGLAIEGRLDTNSAPELEDLIKKVAGDWKGIIIDAKDLAYVSSAGLRVFLTIYKQYGELEIINVSETIKEVFSITGMSDIFTIS